MKKIIIFTILLIMIFSLSTQGNRVKTTDYFHVTGSIIDTTASGVEVVPDSVFIATYKGSATPVFSAWFNTGDAQCAAAANNGIIFFDIYGDIDGAGGDGSYYTTAEFYEDDRGLYHITEHWWEVGNYGDTNQVNVSILTTSDNIGINADDVSGNFTSIDFETGYYSTIAESLWVTRSARITTGDTYTPDVNVVSMDDSTISEPTIKSNTIANAKIAARALDMTKFGINTAAAFYGFAIWIDDGASNTNSVVFVDGISTNPVSTLAAARILADSIGVQQYNILNASSFTLDATYENWVFHDIGHNSTLNLGSQDVDNSTFEELIITGTQGGTGTISLIECDIVNLHDFDGQALFCWLVDSLVMDNNSEAFFGNCYSSVAGNGTPKIDFHIASNNVAFRNYSGGINIVNMSSNDKISIEGNGQVIVDATCSNAPITVRGNFTITDNGSGTVWTRQAVFNWKDISDVYYGVGIWIDGGAANTNTTAYVDGTRVKPVSTLVAAKTLADAIGFQRYYIVNSSNLTLAATHENWEFIGIGEGNLIDFGSQDVDGSVFDHLMISGTQGGTGMAGLHDCYLNTIDSLEAIVISSSLSDTISVRVSGNTVFDQCYSNVAGNNTPGLNFNSAGTINVSVRHYSGGLALFNMISTHTISYESDGQLVIDGSCTSANVTTRGNMTITDNGTTTSLTDDAVFNKTELVDDTWGNATRTLTDTTNLTGLTIDIPADGIGAAEMANLAIDADVLANGTIAANKIGLDAITAATIAPDAIGASEIADGAIDSGAVDLNFLYKFWAYDDSTAPALNNQFIKWTLDNWVGGAGTIDSLDIRRWVYYADSLGYADSAGTMGLLFRHIRQSIGAGINQGGSFDSSLIVYVNQLIASLDSTNASMGYDSPDLHTKVDNLSLSGGGSEPETLIVLSSGDSTQIQGARVTIRTIDQSTIKVDGLTTDVNGKLIAELDADSFVVAITANNYTYILDSIVVAAGGQTDTLFMTIFDPGSPSAANLCKVYGWMRRGGVALKGAKVSAFIPDDYWPIYESNVAILARKDPATTDSAGYWFLEVEPNINLSDTTSRWTFEANYNSAPIFYREENIPDTTQYALPAE